LALVTCFQFAEGLSDLQAAVAALIGNTRSPCRSTRRALTTRSCPSSARG
jgi:hypothetical protein